MLVAITGGIGCGKSVVSQLLRTTGYEVYDCDSRAKNLMLTDGSLRRGLTELFGQDTYLPDGSLNRAHVSSCIFRNTEMLGKMNNLVHPAVARDLLAAYAQQSRKLFFFESAVLFESHFDARVHPSKVFCVSSPLDLRIERTMRRDNIQRNKVEERIKSQMAQKEKELLSDIIILNDDRHSIIQQVESALRIFGEQ